MAREILSQQMTWKHSSVETGRAVLWDELFLWSESCEQSLQATSLTTVMVMFLSWRLTSRYEGTEYIYMASLFVVVNN